MSMALYSRKPRRISLTALIDVVFILLMFFMLTSTFNQWRSMEFNAPVQGSQAPDQPPRALVLASDGALHWLGGGRVAEATEQLDAKGFDPQVAVVLLPEPGTSVQQIVGRLEELKTSGLDATLGGLAPVADLR